MASSASATTKSNDEWSKIIADTAQGLNETHKEHPLPEVGSIAFAKTIDHTLLKLDAVSSQFDELCKEARADHFATVCVRPPQVAQCVASLKDSGVEVASVIGFHEGNYDLDHKLQETAESLKGGARELDLVINYEQLKAGNYAFVYQELVAIRAAARPPTLIKLIIETSQLNRDQIVAACTLAGAADLDYVKTSTGFNGPGATEENVRLMAALCDKLAADQTSTRKMKVKASGGVRSLADAVKMLTAGASRLGTSSGVAIAREGNELALHGTSSPTPQKPNDIQPKLPAKSSDY